MHGLNSSQSSLQTCIQVCNITRGARGRISVIIPMVVYFHIDIKTI